MHSLTSLRRIALGAALTGAAIGAVPALASAQPICSFDLSTRVATVFDDASLDPVTVTRFGDLINVKNPNTFGNACVSKTGTPATVTNTDRIDVLTTTHKGPFGSLGHDGVVIDESNGPLAPRVLGGGRSAPGDRGPGEEHHAGEREPAAGRGRDVGA